MSFIITYRVVGRYMVGKEVTAYHFIGSDGSEISMSRDDTIMMINRNLVDNMRIQPDYNNDDIIIRGKGVNLNTLPVYDLSKQRFRGNQASNQAANSNVNVARGTNDGRNMAQFTIIKRIMDGNNCIGYVVKDFSGSEKKLSKKQIFELAKNKRISNAVVQRSTTMTDGIPDLILRGVGCKLRQLPSVALTADGKIIDPTADKSKLVVRYAKMKRSGKITNTVLNQETMFRAGDAIVVKGDGNIIVIPGPEFLAKYTGATGQDNATCDYFLDKVSQYTYQVYGGGINAFTPDGIKTWPMAKYK